MRRAARLVALIIATVLGCMFFFGLYDLRLLSISENGYNFPSWGHDSGIGIVGLAFLSFCALFRFLGPNHGTAKRCIALAIGLLALAYLGFLYWIIIG